MSNSEYGFKSLKLKERVQIAFGLLFVIAIIVNSIYQGHLEHQAKLAKIMKYEVLVSNYKELAKSCQPFDSLPAINYANNPRSNERASSVLNKYKVIMDSKCFTSKNATIYRNPYRQLQMTGISTAAAGTPGYEIWQGIIFDVDSGMPFMRTGGSICADGSWSPSVGRGTCSWHGGYGSQRGEKFEYSLSQKAYDPRTVLLRLKD
jgi:hypothetical protein